ncbi:dephospho-CoA kinase, partial [Streptomyces sp. NPDC006349]|uniref:dephospho-CoA kinase n=1 Tax=Streptomyces sp. NPDC006349 TaxID=3156757 RepID=UPI0033A7AE43
MLSVGLTGGIGAGKSEVSRLLVEHGAVLIDADRIAREVVAPGTPGLAAVVEAFGAALRPRPRGPLLLVHLDRLDDVELPRLRPAHR